MMPIAASKPTGHCSRDFCRHSMMECRLGRGYSHRPLALEDHHLRLPRNGKTRKGRTARSLPCEWAWTFFRRGSAASADEACCGVMACRDRRFGSVSHRQGHFVETGGRALVPSPAMTWSGSFENNCRGHWRHGRWYQACSEGRKSCWTDLDQCLLTFYCCRLRTLGSRCLLAFS